MIKTLCSACGKVLMGSIVAARGKVYCNAECVLNDLGVDHIKLIRHCQDPKHAFVSDDKDALFRIQDALKTRLKRRCTECKLDCREEIL